jgi:hypothetical protein
VNLSPPAVILAAAHVILRAGWTKGARAVDDRGHYCSPLVSRAVAWDLEGALQRAAYCVLALPTGGCLYHAAAYRLAHQALRDALPRRPTRLPRWAIDAQLADFNDHPERTRAEMLALIETALAALPLPADSVPADPGGKPEPGAEPAS